MNIFEATKFVEKQSLQLIADEVGDLFSTENLTKKIYPVKRHLPKEVQNELQLTQALLGGKLNDLTSSDEGKINAALGALGKFLPLKLAGIIGNQEPLLGIGLSNLISGKGVGDILSVVGVFGLATQFLPPWAGDALAVGKQLTSGDLAGAVNGLISKFIPPELKAAYDAIKNASGGLKGLLAELFDKPKLVTSQNGFWAARITDVVVCPGGVGVIDSGLPTVLIGGKPAARVTDTALCNGVPKVDKILLGEPTIRFGGHFASRITDQTVHGGKITTGFPTVHLSKSLGQCESCLTSASSGGAGAGDAGAGSGSGGSATISGGGITNPFSGSLLNELGGMAKGLMKSPLGDLAKNKLTDFAREKVGDLFGSDKIDNLNAQNPISQDKPASVIKPSQDIQNTDDFPLPQPNIFDNEENKDGGFW